MLNIKKTLRYCVGLFYHKKNINVISLNDRQKYYLREQYYKKIRLSLNTKISKKSMFLLNYNLLKKFHLEKVIMLLHLLQKMSCAQEDNLLQRHLT